MPGTGTTGGMLYVDTWGSGAPVVFIHGLGASARYWGSLRRVLPIGYLGVAPDLLGFGRSPAPPDASYDVDCHLAALTPHVPSGSLIVAHSTGAILAAALAARRPDLTAGLLAELALPDDHVDLCRRHRLAAGVGIAMRGSGGVAPTVDCRIPLAPADE